MATGNFDDNIMQNILSRLSLKHVNQLKLVCTRWNNLISDHFFKKTQAVQSINNVLGIITISTASVLYVPIERCKGNDQKLPYIPDPSRACIKAACNGLIFYEPTSQSNNDCYLLSNMTTKSSTSIPKERLLAGTIETVFGLAFHPSSQTTPVVVGCIHGHKEINFCKYSHPPGEEGYNWRIMEEPFRTELKLAKTMSSVFFNGALHWLTKSGDKAIAFNVENDTAYTVELPVKNSVYAGGFYDVWFGVANEKLCLCILKLYSGAINIWEMKDYCTKGTTWVCTKQINMPKGPNKCYSRSMPVLYDGKKVVMFTWTAKSRGIAVYRIQEKKWDKTLIFRDWTSSDRRFFPYIGHAYSLD